MFLNSGGILVEPVEPVEPVGSVGSVGSVGLMTPHPAKSGPPGMSPENLAIADEYVALSETPSLRQKNQIQNAENSVLFTPMKQQAPEPIRLGSFTYSTAFTKNPVTNVIISI